MFEATISSMKLPYLRLSTCLPEKTAHSWEKTIQKPSACCNHLLWKTLLGWQLWVQLAVLSTKLLGKLRHLLGRQASGGCTKGLEPLVSWMVMELYYLTIKPTSKSLKQDGKNNAFWGFPYSKCLLGVFGCQLSVVVIHHGLAWMVINSLLFCSSKPAPTVGGMGTERDRFPRM